MLYERYFRGSFIIRNEDVGIAEANAYWQFLPIIQSKYGPPTRSGDQGGPYKGISSVWQGLQAPNSSDRIEIILMYAATTERCGRNLCTSDFAVIYINIDLQQRLAGRQNRPVKCVVLYGNEEASWRRDRPQDATTSNPATFWKMTLEDAL